MSSSRSQRRGAALSAGAFLAAALMVAGFIHFDAHNQISSVLRSWHGYGIVLSIVVMALLCMTPMPAEGLLLINLKVFGVWWGMLYSWIGAALSAIVVLFIARYVGQPLLLMFISEEKLQQIDQWVERRGVLGLLIARLLPIPGFLINYVVGAIPSVRAWPFVWTAAVSVIPYYVAAALVFMGVLTRFTAGLVLGGLAAMGLLSLLGYLLSRKVFR